MASQNTLIVLANTTKALNIRRENIRDLNRAARASGRSFEEMLNYALDRFLENEGAILAERLENRKRA